MITPNKFTSGINSSLISINTNLINIFSTNITVLFMKREKSTRCKIFVTFLYFPASLTHIRVTCWFFFSLHTLLTMHGHRNLKPVLFISDVRINCKVHSRLIYSCQNGKNYRHFGGFCIFHRRCGVLRVRMN